LAELQRKYENHIYFDFKSKTSLSFDVCPKQKYSMRALETRALKSIKHAIVENDKEPFFLQKVPQMHFIGHLCKVLRSKYLKFNILSLHNQ
jgi:hypothetical protein